MPLFSVIIPVYNRPEEVNELLDSLVNQTYMDFEVIIIEDGSTISSEAVVNTYGQKLDIIYKKKENTGQGFSRNFAADFAKGEYLVFFDSDCLIPEDYFLVCSKYLNENVIDGWGGPDKAHSSFSLIQKATGYTMSGFFTTGGIRGGKKHIGRFQPRSFNMGISKKAFLEVGGFAQTNLGEDVELSMRLLAGGYKMNLIPKAFVYHKRRTSLLQFFHQTKSFGKGRVLSGKKIKGGIKAVHFFPLLFTLGLFFWILSFWFIPALFQLGIPFLSIYFLLIFMDALAKTHNILVALLSIITAVIQLTAYGVGFLLEWVRR